MGKRELFWAMIPYTVLTDVAKWNGSFLLWVVLGLVIIVVNIIITKDWRS